MLTTDFFLEASNEYRRKKSELEGDAVLEDYLMHIASDSVLMLCSLSMAFLFLFDLTGVLSRAARLKLVRHIDFTSSIVSIGIFGTFLGILNGLYAFNTDDISRSVPALLEGLKFAFATSVLGMLLSLVLSVFHKVFGGGDDETEVLNSIDQKMDRLTDKLGALATAIESPAELVNQFTEMKTFLKAQLEQINKSLDDALEQLASGATNEVIEALERVIYEFNTNLQEQFGENFKELNAACLKLLEWQRNYREHVDKAESHLSQIRESLDDSAEAASELTASNRHTQEICRDVAQLIKTYDVQVRTLEGHMQSLKELGHKAQDFLESTQSAITLSAQNMESFSGTIENSVRSQSESLSSLTRDIEKQLPKALGELEDVLTKITNQFAGDYRSLFEFITRKR